MGDCKEKHQYITIYRGEDSGTFGLRQIRLLFETTWPIDAATAEFKFFSYSKIFSTEAVEKNEMILRFAKADTKEFPLGLNYATFRLYDKRGLVITATSKIPILVKTPDKTVFPETESVTVEAECVSITIRAEIDYNCVTNRPKINHVELIGDKSWEDLGLPSAVSSVITGYLHEGEFYRVRSGSGTVEDPYVYSDKITPIETAAYIDKEGNKIYRWDGSSYVLIGGSSGIRIYTDSEDEECLVFEYE